MTRPLIIDVTAHSVSTESAETVRALELTRLLESGAYFARKWHGAEYLLVDRTGNTATADIKACLDGGRLVDLWDLNPILWDDVHWAAIRRFAVAESAVLRPVLHRD